MATKQTTETEPVKKPRKKKVAPIEPLQEIVAEVTANPKAWWKSKTIIVNVLALAGSLAISFGFDPTRWAEISTVVLAVANVVLRLVTKEPVGK